jgi:hypothetical protein
VARRARGPRAESGELALKLPMVSRLRKDPSASSPDAALQTLIERDAGISAYRSLRSMRCVAMPRRPASGSIGPGSPTTQALRICCSTLYIPRDKDDPRFAEFCRKVHCPYRNEASLKARTFAVAAVRKAAERSTC